MHIIRIEIDALCTKLQNALYLRPHSEKYLEKIDINSISTLSSPAGNSNSASWVKEVNFFISFSDMSVAFNFCKS